ncbi:MAG TPA: hypothetical protein VF704_02530 [Allosphingosinicella sp.]|jgi:hypothetical protein
MPKWPAYVMGAFALACAYPAITASPPVAESYGAKAAEPAPIEIRMIELAAAASAKS